jgi:hypothetical protein
MSSPLVVDASAGSAAGVRRPARSFRLRALLILWPAFLMAGVLEALVFVVVDPTQLRWFGGEAIEWSRMTVYSVTFFIIWGAIATSGASSSLIASPGSSG